jgi:hypothetical protein
LVYVPLIGILGGLYELAVALFQRLFVAITGTPSEVPMLIAVFLIAAVFTPLRKAMEGAVDRWARGGWTEGADGDGERVVAMQGTASATQEAIAPEVTTTAPLEAVGWDPRPDRGRQHRTRPEADEVEALRTMATVTAIRRLEARVAAGAPDGDATRETHTLTLDGEGKVACPAGARVPFSICLGCPYPISISVAPGQIRCALPVDP